MTGNGKQTTYKNGDGWSDWGMVYDIVLSTKQQKWTWMEELMESIWEGSDMSIEGGCWIDQEQRDRSCAFDVPLNSLHSFAFTFCSPARLS